MATEKELEILITARNRTRKEIREAIKDMQALEKAAREAAKAMQGVGSGTNNNIRQQAQDMTNGMKAQTNAIKQGLSDQEQVRKDYNKRFMDMQRAELKAQEQAVRDAARQQANIQKAIGNEKVADIQATAKRAVGAIEAGAQQEMATLQKSAAHQADMFRSNSQARIKQIHDENNAALSAIQQGTDARIAAEDAGTRAQLQSTLDGIQQRVAAERDGVQQRLDAVHQGVAEEVAARKSALSEMLGVEQTGQREQIAAIQSLAKARVDEINRSSNAEIAAMKAAASQRAGIAAAAASAETEALKGLRAQDSANIQAKYTEDMAAMRRHYAEKTDVAVGEESRAMAQLQAQRDIDLANSKKNYDLLTEAAKANHAQEMANLQSHLDAQVAMRQASGQQAVAIQQSIGSQLVEETRRAVQAQTDEIRRGFENQMSSMRDSSREWEQVSESLFMAGATMSAAITAPLVLGTKAVIGFGSSFEDSMAGVAKTSFDASLSFEENAANVDKLGESFVRMSTVMPVSREEIARVAEIAGQLGISGTENIEKFTETVIRMGESSNLSAEEAADGMARLANVLVLPTSEIDHLGNTIAGLGITMAATESEILNMSFRIAGAGKQAGFTEAEILALAASLASMGVRAEMGGSAISRVIKDITKWTALGGAELEALAEVAQMSADDFAAAWNENPGEALVTFLEGLGRLGEEGAANLQFLDDVGLDGIRVSDILLRMSGNTELVSDALARSNPLWEQNSELIRISNNRFQTLSAQWEMAKNQISAAALELYDRMRPALIAVIGYLSDLGEQLVELIGWFADLPTPILVIASALLAVAAAIGPVLIAMGGFAALMAGLAAITVITVSFSTAMLAALVVMAKIILVIVALSSAIALAIIYWDDLNQMFPTTMGLLTGLAAAFWEVIKVVASVTFDMLVVTLKAIVVVLYVVATAIEYTLRFIKWLAEGFDDLWESAKIIGSGIASALQGPLESIASWVKGATDSIGDFGKLLATFMLPDWMGTAILTKFVFEIIGWDQVKSVFGWMESHTIGLNVDEEAIQKHRDDLVEIAAKTKDVDRASREWLEQYNENLNRLVDAGVPILEAQKRAIAQTDIQIKKENELNEAKKRNVFDLFRQVGAELGLLRVLELQANLAQSQGRDAYMSGVIDAANKAAEVIAMRGAEIRHDLDEAFKSVTLENFPDLVNRTMTAVQAGFIGARDAIKMFQGSGMTLQATFDALKARRADLIGQHMDAVMAGEAEAAAGLAAAIVIVDDAIRRAAEGAYGFAEAIANAHTVHAAFDSAKGQLGQQMQYWEDLKTGAEESLAVLERLKEEQGGVLTPEQENQWENLTWLVGRAAGAMEDDLEPALVSVRNAQAEWIKQLDAINGSDMSMEEKNAAILELSKNFNGALDPAGNLTTGITILTDAINNLVRAILGLPTENPLPPEINTKVNLDTADFDNDMRVTRDEAMDFDETVVSATVDANTEPSAEKYRELTRHWQEYANSNPTTHAKVEERDFNATMLILKSKLNEYREENPITPAQLDNMPFMGTMETIMTAIDTYRNSNPTTTVSITDNATATLDGIEYKLGTLTQTQWNIAVSVGYNDPGFTAFGPGDAIPSSIPSAPAPTSGTGFQEMQRQGGGGTGMSLQSLTDPNSKGAMPDLSRLTGSTMMVPQSAVDFAKQGAENAQSYVAFVQETVGLLADAAASMGEEGLQNARTFAETGKTAMEALLGAWEFLKAMGEEAIVLSEQHHANVTTLNHLLYQIVSLMAQNAESISGDYLAGAETFAAASKSGVEAFTAGLELLTAFDENALMLTEAHHMTLEAVNHLLYKIVLLMAQNAESLNGPMLESATLLADAAVSIASAMTAVLDLLLVLDDRTLMSAERLARVESNLRLVATVAYLMVKSFQLAAANFEPSEGADLMATAVESTVAALTATLDLVTALAEVSFKTVQLSDTVAAKIGQLAMQARNMAGAFATAAQGFEDVNTDGVEPLATTIEAALSTLTATLDLLDMLADRTSHYGRSVVRLLGNVTNLAGQSVLIATAFAAAARGFEDVNVDGVEPLAVNLEHATGALGATIELLDAMADGSDALAVSPERVWIGAKNLAEKARLIADAFREAAEGWGVEVDPEIEALATNVQSSTGALSAVLGFLQELYEGPVKGLHVDPKKILKRVEQLRDFALDIANAFKEVEWSGTIDPEIEALATDVSNSVGILTSMIDLINQLIEAATPKEDAPDITVGEEVSILLGQLRGVLIQVQTAAAEWEGSLGLIETFGTAVEAVFTALETALSLSGEGGEVDFSGIQNIIAGIIDIFHSDLFVKLIEMIQEWGPRLEQSGVFIGESIGYGVATGLYNSYDAIMDVVYDIAENIEATFQSAMDIASPSKRMMRSGMDTGLGVAEGIARSTPHVLTSVSNLAESVAKQLQTLDMDSLSTDVQNTVKNRSAFDYGTDGLPTGKGDRIPGGYAEQLFRDSTGKNVYGSDDQMTAAFEQWVDDMRELNYIAQDTLSMTKEWFLATGKMVDVNGKLLNIEGFSQEKQKQLVERYGPNQMTPRYSPTTGPPPSGSRLGDRDNAPSKQSSSGNVNVTVESYGKKTEKIVIDRNNGRIRSRY